MMNKKEIWLFIICAFFVANCSPWTNTLIRNGNQNDAVRNAISDFIHSHGKLLKNDTVFLVRIKSINQEILGVSILGYPDKVMPGPRNKIGTNYPNFPTMFLEQEGKLFYWYDPDKTVNNEIIYVLSKYRRIDSLNINGLVGIPTSRTGDSKEATDYYFCKANLKNYKKIRTTIAIGGYRPPHLDCDR